MPTFFPSLLGFKKSECKPHHAESFDTRLGLELFKLVYPNVTMSYVEQFAAWVQRSTIDQQAITYPRLGISLACAINSLLGVPVKISSFAYSRSDGLFTPVCEKHAHTHSVSDASPAFFDSIDSMRSVLAEIPELQNNPELVDMLASKGFSDLTCFYNRLASLTQHDLSQMASHVAHGNNELLASSFETLSQLSAQAREHLAFNSVTRSVQKVSFCRAYYNFMHGGVALTNASLRSSSVLEDSYCKVRSNFDSPL